MAKSEMCPATKSLMEQMMQRLSEERPSDPLKYMQTMVEEAQGRNTDLCIAAGAGDVYTFATLLGAKADINTQDDKGA